MKYSTTLANLLVLFGLVILATSPAKAELFGDLYLGSAATKDGNVSRSDPGSSITQQQDFGSSFTLGLRVGYWLEGNPWLGFSVDYSDYAVTILNRDIFVSPLSGLVMLRICGLKSADFPNGRFHPYFALGPGIFHSVEKGSYVPPPFGPLVTAGNPDASIDLGLDLRLGLSWSLRKNLAVFGEYRYTRVEQEFGGNSFGENVRVETELRTNHWIAGISLYFH
jgi:hypothetical protein